MTKKRINTISDHLKNEFGRKTIKLAIDGGFTCPNRDGSKGYGGCTFCSDTGSGEFSSDIDSQIRLLSDKWPDAAYLAYFQNHTNTYAPVDELREKYFGVLKDSRIRGLVIGTRPDCLGSDVLDLLSEINETHFLWVELGLQTIHEKTAEAINRCYSLDVFDKAMEDLRSRGIRTVVHLILGLPGETAEDMCASVRYVCAGRTDGIKLQLLHILKGTDLAKEYEEGRVHALTEDEYIGILKKCVPEIPDSVVVHRLTGDGDKRLLIAPLWSADKKHVLSRIRREVMLPRPGLVL